MPRNTYKKRCPKCGRRKRFHDSSEAARQGWTKVDAEGKPMPIVVSVLGNAIGTEGGRWICPACSARSAA